MSWRTTQLGDTLCDQDQLIIDLFQNNPVRYVGRDPEFARHLQCDNLSSNLILIINHPVWVSDILKICQQNLTNATEYVYLSINRYWVLGNDTDINAKDLVDLLVQIVKRHEYKIIKKSTVERDLGRHFNFVQPLTWIYANKITNQSDQ